MTSQVAGRKEHIASVSAGITKVIIRICTLQEDGVIELPDKEMDYILLARDRFKKWKHQK